LNHHTYSVSAEAFPSRSRLSLFNLRILGGHQRDANAGRSTASDFATSALISIGVRSTVLRIIRKLIS
jgi:hypothetical protein